MLSDDALPPRPLLGAGETNMAARPAQVAAQKSAAAQPKDPEQSPSVADVSAGLVTTQLQAPDQTPTTLVTTLVGTGPGTPVISNVSYTGFNHTAGLFSGGTGIIGFEDGIVLSSGNIASVIGPNSQDAITTNNGLPGDADLNGLIPGFSTFDATILEFDFECPGASVLTFDYVFSSDEYNEYVNSPYNDVFGFFMNGANVALIPGTTTPVAINTINCNNPFAPPSGSHCDLYQNNDLSDGGGAINTEMDGLTQVLTVNAPVQPGVNHIRLAVADAGDGILDSNIFLKKGSFSCNRPPEAACQDVTVSADASCVAAASINAGSTDPDGDEIICTQAPVGPYSLGTTADVLLTCTDPLGASSDCTGDVTVVDDTVPSIVCPASQVAECVNGSASVSYADPTLADNCGVASSGCVPASGSSFGLGNTAVTCGATDTSGNSSSCNFDVAVVDTTPPTVTVQGGGELWPPNHDYVAKTLSDCAVQIQDQCQGLVDLASASPTITCVTSDEVEDDQGNGDGATMKDMVIVNATTAWLRSERAGSLDGRVYAIHFNVTDAAGNVATAVCKTTVPHDQSSGHQPAIDSGVRYTVGTCE